MPLTTGSRLGPYEIVAALGAGGMGQVFRARDTHLGRQVAIKVLPDAVVEDPDRLARFEREARVLAALNHPFIAQVYGFEQGGATRAIVMELVEGPTLDERIRHGPLAIPDALHIARQIAEALETAHELGIVHRDLKPANIKVRDDGTVKVLDFGLAKALDPAQGSGQATAQGGVTNSPTITTPAMTEQGMILGTAAYMSPEQARGRPVDRRADVWAFGVVLYEMLTSTRLFQGEDGSDILAAVLRQPIVLTAVPSATPHAIRVLLARCLERDPRQRLRDIGEARIALERALSPSASDPAVDAPGIPARSRARTLLPWSLFAIAVIALAFVLGSWAGGPTLPDSPSITRIVSDLGVPGSLVTDAGPAAVLSPDGRTIVLHVSRDETTRLYLRRLSELHTVEIPGTEQATNPFFSPDGSRLGFFAAGGLKTMPLSGGAITTVADAATARGAAWTEDGEFIFQSSLLRQTPLTRVTATGAPTDRGTTLTPGEETHRWPQVLPNGYILYSANADVANWDTGVLRVQTEPGVPGKVVLQGGYHGRYVPSGHLLYIHAGTLYGVRFDLDRLETTSEAVPIVERVATTSSTGGAQYSVASNGTLAYVPGNPVSADGRMHWLMADGKTSVLTTTPGPWSNPRFSPDGRSIAMQITSGSHEQIAVYDWGSDRMTTITSGPSHHRYPIWSLDGRHIVYTGDSGGAENIFRIRADGSGGPERLTTSARNQDVSAMHPSGRFVLFSEAGSTMDSGIWVLPFDGQQGEGAPGTARPFFETAGFHARPAFSRDGRLVAYMSSGKGMLGVYVRRSDGVGGATEVSSNGGAHPIWSQRRNELLYVNRDQIMVAPYRFDGTTFTADRPRPWSTVRSSMASPTRKYDLHPDGVRAVVAAPDTSGAMTYDKIVFVFNFFDELKRRLP